jgi:hypothetical protein
LRRVAESGAPTANSPKCKKKKKKGTSLLFF